MKKLFILRGVMGSGKSTFIKENNLEDYTLSSDRIRLLFNSPEMTIEYKDMIPQYNNKKVWELLYQILEERMKKGELTLIDAMHIKSDDLNTYKKLADKYRYRLYIIDFTDVDYEELLKRNDEREEKKWVPIDAINKAIKQLSKEQISKAFTVIKPDEFNNYVNSTPRNVDNYDKVHIFGDIHGCYNTVKTYFDKYNMNDNELYIFTGDYFDRGFENIQVFNFIKENIEKKNFTFLIGNHEARLYKYACDDEYKMDYDLLKTLEEFDNNISKSDLRGLLRGLTQISNIEYQGKQYLITHGGIPYYPDKSLDFYSSNSFIYGIDKYDVDIDNIYNNFMTDKDHKIYQIHGHRNINKIEYNKYEYSYNLDGDIENGGYLRVVTLNSDGSILYNEIKNDNYDPDLIEKENIYKLIDDLRNDKYIYEKEVDNNISSFNFTREAFHNKVWNNMTTQARGLFIDTSKYLVAARSYNKFFNLDEREETKLDNIKDNIEYPVKFYLKYNGYLGILSVINNELVFATKSLFNGTYSDYFKNIFYKLYNDKQIEVIKNRLISNNTSMVFEVIDHINDKHIIEYDEDKLVLLDEIYNRINYSKIDYNELKQFAIDNNIQMKELVYTANNLDEFNDIINKICASDYKLNDNYVEGFVVEDSIGFMFKYKTEYYNKWKLLRSKMEYAVKNNNYDIKSNDSLESDFLSFLSNKYKDKNIDVETINIVDERKDFMNKD